LCSAFFYENPFWLQLLGLFLVCGVYPLQAASFLAKPRVFLFLQPPFLCGRAMSFACGFDLGPACQSCVFDWRFPSYNGFSPFPATAGAWGGLFRWPVTVLEGDPPPHCGVRRPKSFEPARVSLPPLKKFTMTLDSPLPGTDAWTVVSFPYTC